MRILAVTNMYPTARDPSLGRFVVKQIEGLKRIGLDVDVMHVDRTKNGMLAYIGLGKQVCARTAEFQPDIVHIMYGGVMADKVTRVIQNIPTVVSFCGSDLLGEHLSGTFRRFIAGYGVLASYASARRATAIVVKSKNLYDALPSDVGRSKVRIIPNGIDLELFKPLDQDTCRNRLGWRNDLLNVLFPTNGGDPRKRLDLAQAAVEAVKQSGIPVELHQLRGVPYNEVPIWLNASDVVLLTSLHEGSPNTVKEALACNLPVVSVDVGDVRERIDGIEGCCLALPDAGDLAAKLRLVRAGQNRVAGRIKMQDLSLEHIARRLTQFYEDVLSSYGRTRNEGKKIRRHEGLSSFPREKSSITE
jgi:glycosyltransferase involved in cell wall biosynthesis